jgi:hydrogenase expression/formation protein HypE
MAHGGGGSLMQSLLNQVFFPAFDNPALRQAHDGAVLEPGGSRLAFTTDSYVVRPLRFPGGDIGSLAVTGTVNDLAMCGARPAFLSAGFILEEGLAITELQAFVESMRREAARSGVRIVTGDTKVVDHGKCDGLYITTAGIGWIPPGVEIGPQRIRPGDAVLLSGDVGRHGIAIMAQREGLSFDSAIESDCAPLAGAVGALLEAGVDVHCLRDLTRGGLASGLIELAQASDHTVEIDARLVPVGDDVRGACEILGLDPLYVANEGRCVAFVPPPQVDAALNALRSCKETAHACLIGQVRGADRGAVILQSAIGTSRLLDLLSGEQLPRIC